MGNVLRDAEGQRKILAAVEAMSRMAEWDYVAARKIVFRAFPDAKEDFISSVIEEGKEWWRALK